MNKYEHQTVSIRFPGASMYCVLSSDTKNIRVKNVIELKKYNVVKTDWVMECIDKKKLVRWCPRHFLATNPETEKRISEQYDEFGDSYYSKISIDRLKELMQIPQSSCPRLNTSQTINLDKQLFNDENPFALFRGCSAYFQDSPQEVILPYKNDLIFALFSPALAQISPSLLFGDPDVMM